MTTIRDRRSFAVLWALLLAPLALGGCSVVSDAPLFGPEAAGAHRMATGLWAISGPGCEAPPNPAGDLPGCAAPFTVTDKRMSWDMSAVLARVAGPLAAGRAAATLPAATASSYVLVDGDPAIVELLNDEPPPAAAFTPGQAPPPSKPSYLALRVLSEDRSGRIDKAIAWAVTCPPPGQPLPSGLERQGLRCVARTPEAVRIQARTLPPFLSFFLTWVSATIPPPPPPPAPPPEAKTP